MSTATAPNSESTQGQSSMSIRIYNTLTKSKEPFEPITPGKVGIYLCGPTVYKEAHIGHMVGPVIFDTIKRYLTYNGFDVNWVVNITDVDPVEKPEEVYWVDPIHAHPDAAKR